MANAFCDFENGKQKIVDNDPNHERSLKFEHAIPNVITAYNRCIKKVSQAQQLRMTLFSKPMITDVSPAAMCMMATTITERVENIYFTIIQ